MENELDGVNVEEQPKLTLREIVRKAADGYEGTEEAWDHVLDDEGKLIQSKTRELGDTLAEFIIIELGETYDPDGARDEQLYEARRVIGVACRELNDVLNALGEL